MCVAIRVVACVLVSFLAQLCFVQDALAQSGRIIDRYMNALNVKGVFAVLREEGIEAGQNITEDSMGVNKSPAWSARLERIYDTEKMHSNFRQGLLDAGQLEGCEEAIAFYETELGARIINIEIAARKAMSDVAVERTALRKARLLEKENPELYGMYQEFLRVNDIVNSNVTGALNSNLAFFKGMAEGQKDGGMLSENFMLETVWQQEPEVRKEMENWSISFSTLAYSGLTPEEMQAYIDISKTDAGQHLNRVLFAGFDRVFEQQSYDLGLATAEFMRGEDI